MIRVVGFVLTLVLAVSTGVWFGPSVARYSVPVLLGVAVAMLPAERRNGPLARRNAAGRRGLTRIKRSALRALPERRKGNHE